MTVKQSIKIQSAFSPLSQAYECVLENGSKPIINVMLMP